MFIDMSKCLLSIEDSIDDRHSQAVSIYSYVSYLSGFGVYSTLVGHISGSSSIPQDKCEYSSL